MATYHFSTAFPEQLFSLLAKQFELIGPRRLQGDRLAYGTILSHCELTDRRPLLSPRQHLLPTPENLEDPTPAARTILILPSCDLGAVTLLDRIFVDDPLYQKRRGKLLLIGHSCQPETGCRCPPLDLSSGDLFWEEPDRLHSLSLQGEAILAPFAALLTEVPETSPVSQAQRPPYPSDLEKHFRACQHEPFWEKEAKRCFSCGTCSAVCPTCYCFDVVESPQLNGSSRRLRQLDNCFFADFSRVAGGHNFHPTRTERLQHRFGHKYLGISPHQGEATCVGCGRCLEACPAKIDLNSLLNRVMEAS